VPSTKSTPSSGSRGTAVTPPAGKISATTVTGTVTQFGCIRCDPDTMVLVNGLCREYPAKPAVGRGCVLMAWMLLGVGASDWSGPAALASRHAVVADAADAQGSM
jgi:hypothetical protein